VTDPRPRPQYGEYATPEEQAKAMGVVETPTDADAAPQAPADATAVDTDGEPPVMVGPATGPAYGEVIPGYVAPPAPEAAPAEVAPAAKPAARGMFGFGPTAVEPAAPGTPALTPAKPRRLWNTILTAVFLGFGLVSVTSSIPQYADFAATMQLVVTQMGYDGYGNTELANAIGIGINVTQIVLFVLTAGISMWVLRRGHISFYIPIAGAVLFIIVFIVLLVIALTGDPTLMQQISGGSGA